MTFLVNHSERNVIRLQLKQNTALAKLSEEDLKELESQLLIADGGKAEFLQQQGMREMSQYFIVDGILKRVVSNPEGKEMILRFACERDMETVYAAWRLGTPTPYGIVGVSKFRIASLPMKDWGAFLDARPEFKQAFEYDVMKVMSDIMAHVITLHLLDAPGRVQRFMRKHPDLVDRIPQKELASYLNLSAETLSRLRHSGKITNPP
ncbi:Crp/Fnr family transcriptional regulator [Paucibacter sp. R3-3]|uniref:Crp/Fnr family transcriptional regulator n=1 Tax=Roseateles agri TaxID=3098619 RepID=A0ABU5DHE3_9BURK|nr:Crp/Fnr family transcriptional regulator [Paucibacter sp. R3-3]MDY0745699.1 Crp/Fnr family transcriptional regulator [Paucibacter sp. R3-3]